MSNFTREPKIKTKREIDLDAPVTIQTNTCSNEVCQVAFTFVIVT